jgi:type IV pilus assembly protein PilC
MPKFWWEGIDSSGKQCKGFLFAESNQDLSAQLLQRGVALLKYRVADKNFLPWGNRLSKYDFIEFFEQVSILLDGGVDLLSAVKIIQQQAKIGKVRDVLTGIKDALQNGKSFSVALQSYKSIFDAFIIQMVQVGQHTGNLGFVCAQIASYLKKNKQLKKNLINAAMMPVFTMLFALLIIFVILIFVVPQFQLFFKSLGKNVPSSTRRIIAVSRFLRSVYGMWFFILVGLVGWCIFFMMDWNRLKKIKDGVLLRIPYVKNFVELSNMTYFIQALTALLKSGIPIKDAIDCAKNSVNNLYLKERLGLVLDNICIGRSLSESVASMPYFYKQDNLVALIKVGERSGKLGDVLSKAADAFQEELTRFIAMLESFFQPVLLIIVGLVIGILIWIIYLPIFSLAYSLN